MRHTVWAAGFADKKNISLAFTYDVACEKDDLIEIKVSASNVYRFFADDKIRGLGPARAAHGYARYDEYGIVAEKTTTYLTFEVVSYRVNSYCYINEEPFFDCEVKVNGRLIAVSSDFFCYELTDRVRKVQRYSFQRPFIEVYNAFSDRKNLYLRKSRDFPKADVVSVCGRKPLERKVGYPTLEETECFDLTERGKVEIDPQKKVWKDRSIYDIGDTLGGFLYRELDDKVSDKVSLFAYFPDENGENEYLLFDGGKEYSGLIKFSLDAEDDCSVYLVFDETVSEKKGENGEIVLDFSRLECCNVIKYNLRKGKRELLSFEAYSLRFLKVISFGGRIKDVKASVIKVENPYSDRFKFTVADETLRSIISAGIRTYSQNTLDLLMDCPSRERAGWTNDSYFSAKASYLIAGDAVTEDVFLENLLLSPQSPYLPEGMLPMCYPCDHPDGVFAPTCSVWVILEAIERATKRGSGFKYEKELKDKAYGLLKYFKNYENDDKMLENLDGWIFVEWSMANSSEYVGGVNFPTNMMYCGLKKAVGKFFSDETLLREAEELKEKIIGLSFNGRFFEDNALRENGELVLKNHLTETCQYYAFYFGIADKNRFPVLYETVFSGEDFATDNSLTPSNMIIGFILRTELMQREGKKSVILKECRERLGKMALRTDTLWEHLSEKASCNHLISSICIKWILYALTGYKGVGNGEPTFDEYEYFSDASFSFEAAGKRINVTAGRNGRKIEVDEK